MNTDESSPVFRVIASLFIFGGIYGIVYLVLSLPGGTS